MKSSTLRAVALSGTILLSPLHYKSSPNITKHQLQELFSAENKKIDTTEKQAPRVQFLADEPEKHTENPENIEASENSESPVSIEQKKTHKEKQEKKPDFISVSSSDLKGSPFDPAKPMISINATNLLGATQHEKILSNFNKTTTNQSFSEQLNKGIKIPLIYPELKHTFPETLSQLKKDPHFKTYTFASKNQLLLIKTKNNHNALAYYQDGKLKMATYVSIGSHKRTKISGQYPITPDQIRRRSRKYGRSPMPYALHIKGGYFLHQGTSNGTPLSHGCIRVPGFYQQWLYQQVKSSDKTQIIIHNPYQITQFQK